MIESAVVEEIHRLLDAGALSQRKIALETGVSRGTVNAIALGKRILQPRRGPEAGDDFLPPTGPVARCPICGGMVRMPCLACRVRAGQRDRRLSNGTNRSGPSRSGRLATTAW